MKKIMILSLFFMTLLSMNGQQLSWTADNGNGTYTNPLFYDEFSDPDIIRVGDSFYLVGTTMHCNPGLVVLESKDLVNWDRTKSSFSLPVTEYSTSITWLPHSKLPKLPNAQNETVCAVPLSRGDISQSSLTSSSDCASTGNAAKHLLPEWVKLRSELIFSHTMNAEGSPSPGNWSPTIGYVTRPSPSINDQRPARLMLNGTYFSQSSVMAAVTSGALHVSTTSFSS